MKKHILLAVVLMCIISLSSLAQAEEFELRSGIHFGDTIEVIAQKETTLTRDSDTSNSFTGKIAGFSDSTCDFSFDDDNKMVSMTYEFDCFSRDTTKSNYKTLYDSLVRKYGKPEGNTGGDCELIIGPALIRMALWVYGIGEMDGYSADYYDYDEWVVECDDYYVKIDLVSYYYRDDDYEYTYTINLSYYKYTDADYQEKLNEKRSEREEVDNDL